jgi:dienelactone hydrolase
LCAALAVLVVHENRGLNPHIEDIVRRLALDNFVAFAPDALTPRGTRSTPQRAQVLLQAMTHPTWEVIWVTRTKAF